MALVLVVDDEKLVARAAASLLKLNGFQAEALHSGEQTLKRLREEKPLPDLVILDIAMPVMDGMDVLRQIRADASLSSIKVVMYSALGDEERIAACHRLGAVDYIVKTGDWPDLLRRVGRAVAGPAGQTQDQDKPISL